MAFVWVSDGDGEMDVACEGKKEETSLDTDKQPGVTSLFGLRNVLIPGSRAIN